MKYMGVLLLVCFLISSCVPPAPTALPATGPAGTPTASSTETPPPSPIPRQTRTPRPTPTQPGGGSGEFIFDFAQAGFQRAFPDLKAKQVVFAAEIDGSRPTPLMDAQPGSIQYIQAISPNGKMLLVGSYAGPASQGALVLVQRGWPRIEPVRLAETVGFGRKQAIFLDDTRIVYLNASGTYLVNIDGTGRQKIGSSIGAFQSIESVDAQRVYWGRIQPYTFRDTYRQVYARGDGYGLWWTNLDGSASGPLESNGVPLLNARYAFSPDHKQIAWIPGQEEPDCSYISFKTTMIRDGTYTQQAAHPKPSAYDETLSGRGQTIDMAWVDAYVHRCFILYVAPLFDMDHPIRILLVPAQRLLQYEYVFGRKYQLIWMPDSSRLLVFNNGTDNFFVDTSQEPVLYTVDPASPQPTLAEWKPRFFVPTLGRQLNPISISPDGQHMLFLNTGNGMSIILRDLETGAYSLSFALALSPYSAEVPIGSIFWLP